MRLLIKRPKRSCPNCEKSRRMSLSGFECPYCQAAICPLCWIDIPGGNGSSLICQKCNLEIAVTLEKVTRMGDVTALYYRFIGRQYGKARSPEDEPAADVEFETELGRRVDAIVTAQAIGLGESTKVARLGITTFLKPEADILWIELEKFAQSCQT